MVERTGTNEWKETEVGRIPKEWEVIYLKEYCIKIGSGSTPRGGKSVYIEDGISLIRSQNVLNNSFSKNGLVYINDASAGKLKNVTLEAEDVLLNITGDSVARCCIVPTDYLPGRVNQHVCIIRVDKEKINPYYLQSFLVSNKMQNYMLSLAQSGGTRAALTKGMVEEFKVPLPKKKEDQDKIAEIFINLNNKIELNNQMNKTLEEMAQAIFKEWFVEFNFPNEDGVPYKDNGGEMVDSELGEIPEGWRVEELGSFVENTIGGEWGKEFADDKHIVPIHSIRGTDIPEIKNGNRGNTPKRFVKEAAFNKKHLKSGDLIIEISGGSPTQSTGRVSYISEEILKKFDNMLTCTNFCRSLRLKDGKNSNLVYQIIDRLYKNNVLFQYENGTTGIKNLNLKSLFTNEKIAYPVNFNVLIDKFNQVIDNFYKKIQYNGEENETLIKTRDTLLPKLMSGEVRV